MMERARQHTFQILTKRPERMQKHLAWRWGEGRITSRHIWHGVSVEDQSNADARIPLLLQTPAAVRFLSVEPLLGPVDLGRWLYNVTGTFLHRQLHWVIVGGESGPGARPCDLAWIRSVVQQAKAAGVPCFVKQLGARVFDSDLTASGRSETVKLRDRKGGDITEWTGPLACLAIREFPKHSPLTRRTPA